MDDPYADVFSISLGPMGHAINAWSAEEMKKRIKSNVIIETVGGINEPALAEQVLAEGKADLIGAARAWISNPNFGRLAYEGKGEDVVPCLRCNKCHVATIHGPYLSVCSVNPEYGLEHQLKKMAPAPVTEPR